MDYTPVFNKLTREGIDKFVEINELHGEVRRGANKKEYRQNLIALMESNPEIETKFRDFYKRTEEAGRKHFFLYGLEYSQEDIDHIRSQLPRFMNEDQRSFDPMRENEKIFYKDSGASVLIKRIRIKKSFNLIGDSEDAGLLTRVYEINLIHFIEFMRFRFDDNRLIYGYDSYGKVFEKNKIEKELTLFVQDVMGGEMYRKATHLITADKIDALRFMPDCIVSALSNNIDIRDQATFRKERADIDRILRDIKAHRYELDQIKEQNSDLDVQTNPLLGAGIEKSLATDLDLQSDQIEFLKFTAKSGIVSAFRVRVDASRDLVITFSDSVTKEELSDVFTELD